MCTNVQTNREKSLCPHIHKHADVHLIVLCISVHVHVLMLNMYFCVYCCTCVCVSELELITLTHVLLILHYCCIFSLTDPNDYNITFPLDVVIPGGSNTTRLVVVIVDDDVYEQTLEYFTINLTSSNPEATIGARSRAEITIIDDDVYTLSFESFPTRVVESVGKVVVAFQVQVPAGGTEISEEYEIFFDILLENADCKIYKKISKVYSCSLIIQVVLCLLLYMYRS